MQYIKNNNFVWWLSNTVKLFIRIVFKQCVYIVSILHMKVLLYRFDYMSKRGSPAR